MLYALRSAGGELRCGITIAADSAVLESADVIAIATGSRWDTPRLAVSGRSSDPATRPAPALLGLDRAIELAGTAGAAGFGAHTVILDATGTLPPLALAELLSSWGVRITFVTSNASIGAAAYNELELQHVMPPLERRAAVMLVSLRMKGWTERGLMLESVWGATEYAVTNVDSVVCAESRSPENQLATELRRRHEHVRCIGDALSPRSTAAVIHEAAALARWWPE
jgi:hypothetical protein